MNFVALYCFDIESLISNQKSETGSVRGRRGVVYSQVSPSSIFHRDKYFAVIMTAVNNQSDFFSSQDKLSDEKLLRAYLKTALFDVHFFY